MRVWDVATGACELVLEGHTNWVVSVSILPDGRILSGSWDDTLRVWDAATGACERVISHDDSDRHLFQRLLKSQKSPSSTGAVKGPIITLSASLPFVCESKITHSLVTAAGLLFVFCASGRLHVLRQVSAASVDDF